jgi:hypothetical protein
MMNHASGREIWDVMFELARVAGYAVMPAGVGTYVADVGAIDNLPSGVPKPIVVIASGHELLAAIEAA